VWPLTSVTIGGVTYSKTQALFILAVWPWSDATYYVADELIAAKLNLAYGANSSTVAATVAAADSWLQSNPLGSNPSNPTRAQGVQLADVLDSFNEGRLGPPRCDDDPF